MGLTAYRLEAAMVSDRGLKRRNNEDNYFLDGVIGDLRAQPELRRQSARLLSEDPTQIYAVCDGMGGAARGEEAALIAAARLRSLRERLLQMEGDEVQQGIAERICTYARSTSHIVRQKAEQYGGAEMGTTLAMLCVRNGVAFSVNIGDSRVYLMRGRKLIQLSIDQTDAERKARQGLISRDDIATHAGRNRLISFIGQPSDTPPEPCIRRGIEVWQGDQFLLCSDGLTDMLPDDRLRALCLFPGNPERIARRLVDAALQAGGKDNVTVVVLRVRGTRSWH